MRMSHMDSESDFLLILRCIDTCKILSTHPGNKCMSGWPISREASPQNAKKNDIFVLLH
jgi:hypothetical protein